MQKRYVPNQQFVTHARGRSCVFSPTRQGRDGTLGYTVDEVEGVPKKILVKLFRVVSVEVDAPVETATAGPGEKRQTAPRKKPAAKKP
jgi:hypothetical protein